MVTALSHCIRVLSCTGYQAYKKCFERGSADGEAPSLEGGSIKGKDYAVENSGFEFDNGGNEEKNMDISKENSQL